MTNGLRGAELASAPDPGVGLDVRLLGPVHATRDNEPLALGPAHRIALFATLALRPGAIVLRDELVAAVWGDDPPVDAVDRVHRYVSVLRQVIEPHRLRYARSELLTRDGEAYQLHIPRSSVDALRFAELREVSREHRARGDRPAELHALRSALGLWQGPALDGLPGSYLGGQRARLEELRLSCAERYAELLLDNGRNREAIDVLRNEVDRRPRQESLHRALMSAMSAEGRYTEALALYDRLSDTLLENDGIEPSPPVQVLQRRIADRKNDPDRPAGPAPTGEPDELVGRSTEIAELAAATAAVAAGTGGSILVEGGPGMGKTALLTATLRHQLPTGVRLGWAVGDPAARRTPFATLLDCLESAATLDERNDPLQRIVALVSAALLNRAEPPADQVSNLVEEATRHHPLVLVVDNLHWADNRTQRMLRILLRTAERSPLLLVASVVPGLGGLHHVSAASTLKLAALGPVDAENLVRAVDPDLTGPAVRRLLEEAGGNPSYLRRLASIGDAQVPPESSLLVQAVERQIAALPAGTAQVVRVVAILGDGCTEVEVTVATGLREPEVHAAVHTAREAGILTRSTESLGFQHQVVGRTLRRAMPAVLRTTIHRAVAEHLAARGGPPEPIVARLLINAVPLSAVLRAWLVRQLTVLAARMPENTLALLQQSAIRDDSATALPLTAGAARMLHQLRRNAVSEAGWVAARATDANLKAEMWWIVASSHQRAGQYADAAEVCHRALGEHAFPPGWLDRFRLLVDRLRAHLPGVPTERPQPQAPDARQDRAQHR